MIHNRFWTPKSIILIALFFIIACGGTTSAPAGGGEAPTPTVVFEVIPAISNTPIPHATAAVPMPTAAPTAPPEVVRTTGGILPMIAFANITAQPVHVKAGPLLRFIGPMYSNLIEFNPETEDANDIRGDLAESWELAEDGLTYTFHLVDNAKWHDGEPLTSDDVMFSFLSMTCPDCIEVMEGQRRNRILFRKNIDLDGSRAVDPFTVEIKTKFVSPDFISQLAMDVNKIVPEHVASKILQTAKAPEELVGSGPFKYVNLTKDVGYEHEKNEDYYKEGYPRLDGLKHFIITDPGTVIAAYETGQVLLQNGTANNLSIAQSMQLAEENPELKVLFKGPGLMFGIMINTTVEPFDDPRVRRAIYLAIHRQPIIETLASGKGWLGVPFPPGQWYSMTQEEAAQAPGFRELNGEKHPADLAEAKRLMKEAGLENGFETEFTARVAMQYVDQAILVSEQLDRFLNIKSTVRQMESAAGLQASNNGDFAMMPAATSLAVNSPTGAIVGRYEKGGNVPRRTGGGKSGTGDFLVPGIQEIYDAQAKELDPKKREDLARNAEQILLNGDNAFPGLWWRFSAWVYNERIQNFHPVASSQLQYSWEHLWCDPRC